MPPVRPPLWIRPCVQCGYATFAYHQSSARCHHAFVVVVVVVVVVIFFQYNKSIDIVDELVLNRNSMIHRLVIILLRLLYCNSGPFTAPCTSDSWTVL